MERPRNRPGVSPCHRPHRGSRSAPPGRTSTAWPTGPLWSARRFSWDHKPEILPINRCKRSAVQSNLGRAEPVLSIAASNHVDQTVHELTGVGGSRGGHTGQLPPPLPALLPQIQRLHRVQPLLVRAALAPDAACTQSC